MQWYIHTGVHEYKMKPRTVQHSSKWCSLMYRIRVEYYLIEHNFTWHDLVQYVAYCDRWCNVLSCLQYSTTNTCNYTCTSSSNIDSETQRQMHIQMQTQKNQLQKQLQTTKHKDIHKYKYTCKSPRKKHKQQNTKTYTNTNMHANSNTHTHATPPKNTKTDTNSNAKTYTNTNTYTHANAKTTKSKFTTIQYKPVTICATSCWALADWTRWKPFPLFWWGPSANGATWLRRALAERQERQGNSKARHVIQTPCSHIAMRPPREDPRFGVDMNFINAGGWDFLPHGKKGQGAARIFSKTNEIVLSFIFLVQNAQAQKGSNIIQQVSITAVWHHILKGY